MEPIKIKRTLTLLCLLAALVTNSQKVFDTEKQLDISEHYKSQEIQIKCGPDQVVISGTLIYPVMPFDKVVIIVPGSGKDTRHAHFVLAEQFLSNQIAVYRFDERGIGSSAGKYNETATSLKKDVISIFEHLKKENILANKQIGILGHSLGGIASIGAHGSDCNFDFMIQMATPVEDNGAFLKYQALTQKNGFYTIKGKSTSEVVECIDVIRKSLRPDEDYKTSKQHIKDHFSRKEYRALKHLIHPAIIDLMKQNHEKTYKASQVPILYIIGSKDQKVSSKNEIQILEKLNNPNITISLIDGLDHWLTDISASTSSKKSKYHINDQALRTIIDWTLAR